MPDIEKLKQEAEEARDKASCELLRALVTDWREQTQEGASIVVNSIIAATIVQMALQRAEAEELAFGEMRARAGIGNEISDDPAPIADDGWIKWEGGECPVDEDTKVIAKMRSNGMTKTWSAGALRWKHEDDTDDIIAYRVIQPAADRVSES